MSTDGVWRETGLFGLQVRRRGLTVVALRLLGWEEALPRSLAVLCEPADAAGADPAVVARLPEASLALSTTPTARSLRP
ncbi:hypothetical protein [Streptomyces sp. AP-93]|uniref:hypothetical protein n=1 Tax=Streptomyces sp. AP-93 TaxID=2929048 RepID=UPI001FAF59E9|nr:hypothetical protein [Streptomyces sp. AP-93]MCJ0872715.1 hypothetical protein [Streptomyces sp. AP-93]